jgi:methoxymalonate biosynthesis protein
MKKTLRLLNYGRRFLFSRAYRNKVLDLIDRTTVGVAETKSESGENHDDQFKFLKGKRLFAAAGCELTFVLNGLASQGMEIVHTYEVGRPSDPMSEMLLPGSKATSELWDVYLLSVAQLFRGMVRKVQIEGIAYPQEQQEQDLSSIIDNFRQAIGMIREKSVAPIFLYSYVLTYIPTYGLHEYRSMKGGWSLIELLHVFHLRLYELAREFSAVYVFDPNIAIEGVGKKSVIDAGQSNGIFDHISREGAKPIEDQFIRQLAVLQSNRRQIKCAVFDLDGTLWAGVIREDGPSGVAVREYYLNTMEILASRGILLALCSKNDMAEDAHLPGLLGKEVYSKIVSKQLSWKPKSQALKDIAEDLNIGLNSLAFFDDSPFERAEVAANAPEVLVLTPEDIFLSPNMLEFQQPGEITTESLSRTKKYKQQAVRKDAERAAGTSLEDFLRSCELKLDLHPTEAAEISRVFEMLGRTNQLNATLARTSLEQLKDQMKDRETYHPRTVKLSDRFGDYGLVGFGLAKSEGEKWRILELAFSCRAMGRGIERALLHNFAVDAQAAGATAVFIDFACGPRNQQMLQILKECGFGAPDGQAPVEGTTLRLELPLDETMRLTVPEWLNPDEAVAKVK